MVAPSPKETSMSQPAPDGLGRACRECGAPLSFWSCEVCGSDPLDAVSHAYLVELASPWRSLSARRQREPSEELLPLAA